MIFLTIMCINGNLVEYDVSWQYMSIYPAASSLPLTARYLCVALQLDKSTCKSVIILLRQLWLNFHSGCLNIFPSDSFLKVESKRRHVAPRCLFIRSHDALMSPSEMSRSGFVRQHWSMLILKATLMSSSEPFHQCLMPMRSLPGSLSTIPNY
jgi:hypothetical protein